MHVLRLEAAVTRSLAVPDISLTQFARQGVKTLVQTVYTEFGCRRAQLLAKHSYEPPRGKTCISRHVLNMEY